MMTATTTYLFDGDNGPFGNAEVWAIHISIVDNIADTLPDVIIDVFIAANTINYLHPNSSGNLLAFGMNTTSHTNVDNHMFIDIIHTIMGEARIACGN